jgi:hypothetical protein
MCRHILKSILASMFILPFHWKDADPFRRVGYLALLNAFYDAKSNWGVKGLKFALISDFVIFSTRIQLFSQFFIFLFIYVSVT